jgi:hypothetical protein
VAFFFFVKNKSQGQTHSDMLQKFSLRPCTEILLDLYLLKQRERSGEEIVQPLITIMPGNKLPVSGFLIDFKDNKDQRGVVLELEGSSDVAFLELYWITGMSIHEADRIAHLLIDLNASDVKSSSTRLEVKTKMSTESKKLNDKIGQPITFNLADADFPASGQQLYLTSLFITDVTMSLIEIAKTDLGKESIKNIIKTITIQKGPWDLKLAEGTLTIFYDFNLSHSTNSARSRLIERIYNLL